MKRFVIVFVAFALLLAGCRDKEASVHKARILAFGTLIDVSIADETESLAEQATESLEQLFQSMHKRWHAWDPGPLKHTNQLLSEGRPFTAPEQILPLLKLSIPLAEKSEHLFNPAVGKLIDAWGFQGKKTECHTLPNSEQILPLVQQAPKLSDLTVDGTQITNRNPAVKLDFGAVGKGYGIDLAIARLRLSTPVAICEPSAIVAAGHGASPSVIPMAGCWASCGSRAMRVSSPRATMNANTAAITNSITTLLTPGPATLRGERDQLR
jgi:thiamine biosynthesis lipoprotein